MNTALPVNGGDLTTLVWDGDADAVPVLGVHGITANAAVFARIAAELADATWPAPAEDGAPAPSWPAGPHQESVRRQKEQTALVLGFPGPSRGDPSNHTLQVLSNAISGLALHTTGDGFVITFGSTPPQPSIHLRSYRRTRCRGGTHTG
jgi:hypothetical protein